MKKTFQAIGIITLLIGSFMYTEEVSTTSKLSDELLTEIKEKSGAYKIEPKEAIINGNTITPGINGRKVLIKESYEKMKEIGYFNDKLLVYENILVKEPLKNNKDKYIISGNENKKEGTLIFKVSNTNDIETILKILNNEKATFYINSTFLENNHNIVIKLLQKGHTVGNLSNNEDYSDPDFVWMKTIFTSTPNQKNNYCYTEKENKEIINSCKIQNSYTIMPTPIKDRPLTTIKKELKPGFIFALDSNKETIKELKNIINYINAKGYKLKSLEKLLAEDINS